MFTRGLRSYVLCLLWISTALCAQNPGLLRQFSGFELLPIENQRNEKGQKIPDEFVPTLHNDILYAVGGLHLFNTIQEHRDSNIAAPPTSEKVMQLKVRVVGYSGAQNQARVSALVFMIDKQTGRELLQKRVDARLRYDQGAFTSALRKLTRSIADLLKDNW